MRLLASFLISLLLPFACLVSAAINPSSQNPGSAKGLSQSPGAPGQTAYLPFIGVDFCPSCYYVDGLKGSDSGLGTSPDQAWQTIQKAADSVPPGSIVMVLSGDYSERVQVTRSGAPGAPITFLAEDTVIMSGFTIKADFISIAGFEITNTADDWEDGYGIWVQGSNCDIEGNYIHFATRGGIRIFAQPGDEEGTNSCTVKNNRLYRNALAGIEVFGRNHLIEGNEIWGTIQYHPNWSNPPSSVDADGIRFFGVGHVIRKNYIHDITYADPENVNPHIDCFQTWESADYESAQDTLIEQNWCRNLEAHGPNENGQGFMIENANNLTIRNNIIQAYRSVNAVASESITILNNTFTSDLSFSSTEPSAVSLQGTPNTVLKNNIYFDIPGPILYLSDNQSKTGLDSDYNCVYRSDGKEPSGRHSPHDLWQVNPLFVNPDGNDFHLQAGSPAKDAGAALQDVTNDYDDVPRPQGKGYAMGAYER